MPLLTLILAVTLTSQTNANDSKWIDVTSRDGACSFSMPVKPTEKSSIQQSPQGDMIVLDYSCLANNCIYRVEKTKLPVAMADKHLEGALTAARDSVIKKPNSKVKLLDSKPTVVAGWPALEYTIEAPLGKFADRSTIAILMLSADQNFYQIRVFSLKDDVPPKDVRKFFDSFKPKVSRPAKE